MILEYALFNNNLEFTAWQIDHYEKIAIHNVTPYTTGVDCVSNVEDENIGKIKADACLSVFVLYSKKD